MVNALTLIGLSSVSVFAIAPDQKCTYSLEVLQIQDASASFTEHVEKMAVTTTQLTAALKENFGEVKYAISSFVDKPIPTRGIGPYGNVPNMGFVIDWCFALHTPLGGDDKTISDGLDALSKNMGNGGDFPENPYEGFLLAAHSKQVGWSSPETTHSDSGRPIARLSLLITDDIPHYPPDAVNGANIAWNYPRTYADYDKSSGGFGAKTWGEMPNMIFYRDDADRDAYSEMCDLFRITDLGGERSNQEETRLNELIKLFGPYPWPDMIPHPGDDSLGCELTEYPSLQQVADALNAQRISPIVLVAQPAQISRETSKHCAALGIENILDCLVETYTRDFASVGINAIVKRMTSSDVIETIVAAIGEATNDLCLRPTTLPPTESTQTTNQPTPLPIVPTPAAPTEPPTETTAISTVPTETPTALTTIPTVPTESSTEPTTTPTIPTKIPTDSTTTPTVLTSTTEPSTPPLASTEASNTSETNGSPGTVTESLETSAPGSYTTDEGSDHTTLSGEVTSAYITTSSTKKSNIAVIAGATGGAVAGAAVLAGVLYKKFGMSMFGGSSPVSPDAIAQVDVAESPVEREMLEEVSMDMFQ